MRGVTVVAEHYGLAAMAGGMKLGDGNLVLVVEEPVGVHPHDIPAAHALVLTVFSTVVLASLSVLNDRREVTESIGQAHVIGKHPGVSDRSDMGHCGGEILHIVERRLVQVQMRVEVRPERGIAQGIKGITEVSHCRHAPSRWGREPRRQARRQSPRCPA